MRGIWVAFLLVGLLSVLGKRILAFCSLVGDVLTRLWANACWLYRDDHFWSYLGAADGVTICVMLAVVGFLLWMAFSSLIRALLDKFAIMKECLGDEEAICKLSDDRLGRMCYVRSLRWRISHFRGEGSHVLGIYGEWGEGKTSAIRLMEADCKKNKDRAIKMVWFNPWSLIEHDDLTAELFKCIGRGLGVLRHPVLSFMFLRYASKNSVKGIPRLDGALDAILLWTAKLSNLFNDLDSLKFILKSALRNHGRQIVVVIDDLDRLSKKETISIVRAIKTNGDLPNVAYLLLVDESRLAKMLKDEVGDAEDGRFYLEKIVQSPMPLWPISYEKLLAEAKRIVGSVFQRHGIDPHEISDDDVCFCLEKFVNLRQIKRLSFALSGNLAYYCAMQSEGKGEYSSKCPLNLEASDILRLCAVRMQFPEQVAFLYAFYSKWMRQGNVLLWQGFDKKKEEYDELFGGMEKKDRSWYERFIRETMQIDVENTGDAKGNYIPYGIREDACCVGFRISSPRSFHRYFNVVDMPSDMVDRESRNSLIEAIRNFSGTGDAFQALHHKVRLFHLLEVVCEAGDLKVGQVTVLGVMQAVNWILCNVKTLEPYEESKRFRTMDAALTLMVAYVNACAAAKELTDDNDQKIRDWILTTKPYAVALRYLHNCIAQAEPEMSYEPYKITGDSAKAIWKMLKEDLSEKIFTPQIEGREDAWMTQKLFVRFLLEKMPTDGETFKRNRQYMVESMSAPIVLDRLKTFAIYVRQGRAPIERLSRIGDSLSMKDFYWPVLEAAEKYWIDHIDDIRLEDLNDIRIMTSGYVSKFSSELDDKLKDLALRAKSKGRS